MNIFLLSIPRPITWCSTPGASSLDDRGIGYAYQKNSKYLKQYLQE
jgi:hypothetical protein